MAEVSVTYHFAQIHALLAALGVCKRDDDSVAISGIAVVQTCTLTIKQCTVQPGSRSLDLSSG